MPLPTPYDYSAKSERVLICLACERTPTHHVGLASNTGPGSLVWGGDLPGAAVEDGGRAGTQRTRAGGPEKIPRSHRGHRVGEADAGPSRVTYPRGSVHATRPNLRSAVRAQDPVAILLRA